MSNLEKETPDVFISYSSKDKDIAFKLCNALENQGIICWIAPRNIGIGLYANAIVEGIESSKVFILIFSQNSNDSIPVTNEVNLAMHSELPIIPIRIEEILPTKAMKFYLKSMHWFDVLNPKSSDSFKSFISMLKENLEINSNNHYPKAS